MKSAQSFPILQMRKQRPASPSYLPTVLQLTGARGRLHTSLEKPIWRDTENPCCCLGQTLCPKSPHTSCLHTAAQGLEVYSGPNAIENGGGEWGCRTWEKHRKLTCFWYVICPSSLRGRKPIFPKLRIEERAFLWFLSHSWGQRQVAFNKVILRWFLELQGTRPWRLLRLRMGQTPEKGPLGARNGCCFLQFHVSFLSSTKPEAAEKARRHQILEWGAPPSGPMDPLADGPWGLDKNESRVRHEIMVQSRCMPQRTESRDPCS